VTALIAHAMPLAASPTIDSGDTAWLLTSSSS